LVLAKDLLKYKSVLIVDDEPDVLETLEALLPMCDVVRAATFEEAKGILEAQYFDIVILDIMGVDGYKLLEIANRRKAIAMILTAHALSPEDTVKSFKQGAASYVPKEKISEIAVYLNDILEAQEKGKSLWWKWLDRFASYYANKFGPDWKEVDKDFWEKFQYWQ
jgi:DNA-binding response OmpR family regulator